MAETTETNNRTGELIDFLEARRRLIDEHGTSSRGARSPLLEPLRKILKAPDIEPYFDVFIYKPENCLDLVHNVVENHGIAGSTKDILQALAHLGVEEFSRQARENYLFDNRERATELIRSGANLAIAAGDWMTAEKIWLELNEFAAEAGPPDPKLQQQVLFEMGNMLSSRDETESAIEYYILCDEMMSADNDIENRVKIQLALGREYLASGEGDKALTRYRSAGELIGDRNMPDERFHSQLGRGLALESLDRIDEALACTVRAIELADAGTDLSNRIAARRHLSRVLDLYGIKDEPYEYLLDAIRLSSLSDDIESRMTLLYDLFDLACRDGRWGDFQLELLSFQNRIHETEEFHLLGPLLVLAARAHTERGLLHLALHSLEEAEHLFNAMEQFDRLEEVQATLERLRIMIAESRH